MYLLAENIWIVDGETVSFYSLPYTTRMTVVRLEEGGLWIHSPVGLTDTLRKEIDKLGEVKYLIAPNHLHHLFLGEWQEAYPNAQTFGTPEVIDKRRDLKFDNTLGKQENWPLDGQISQRLFTGSRFMAECVFFHHRSKTLIVTDLIENFDPYQFNNLQRPIARLAGILAPEGKMPIDWRLSFMFNKATAREHMETIIGWNPERIVMAHGEIIPHDAVPFLMRSFDWLLD
ncbi:DUF4336 domain-containing protein [Enterovibrio paralichthyis]|uniref:DUF4336 domain-containing protein n=1 Tax=Enterovibrio paralichthyis TaxID=2853805 RepID=UPI001C466CFA|nr:DUF4336 domain-containing protein [Enterovibrio paralichthyis]MBV7296324.1 DUF4336 domain-containing protein [Enterovibrio paralichthyis]